MPDRIELKLILNPAPQTDAEELDRLTRQLRRDILDLEVEDVRLPEAGEVTAGAKGSYLEVGALLITLLVSSGAVPPLIELIRSLLTHHSLRSATLEIDGDKLEVQGLSAREQRELIEAWMSRHRLILTADK